MTQFIEIKLPGCVVFLTAAEINQLLLSDKSFLETA